MSPTVLLPPLPLSTPPGWAFMLLRVANRACNVANLQNISQQPAGRTSLGCTVGLTQARRSGALEALDLDILRPVFSLPTSYFVLKSTSSGPFFHERCLPSLAPSSKGSTVLTAGRYPSLISYLLLCRPYFRLPITLGGSCRLYPAASQHTTNRGFEQ